MDKTKVMVHFSLFGDKFPIDYVTELLGIEPTESYNKGDVISKEVFEKETAWDLGTNYQESYNVQEQMDQILKPLKNKATIINQLKEDYNLKCKIFIVIKIENGDTPCFYLNNAQIEFANSIKAEIDIDLYANPYKDALYD